MHRGNGIVTGPRGVGLVGLVCWVVAVACGRAGTGPMERALIPRPAHCVFHEGRHVLRRDTPVHGAGEARTEARQLIEALAPAMGFRLPLVGQEPAEGISLALDGGLAEELGGEGYRLRVDPRRIELRAARPAGLFHGIQTLRQLLPPEAFSRRPVAGVDWVLPCVEIIDRPRFAWRGLLVDPARHFIPVEDLKHFIDAMAVHKFNRLQLHLTDNEGWRLEIRRYPRLAELGSRNDWTHLWKGGGRTPCFGYYTREDIAGLVRYAAERHITLVPEIEMPYHAGAAIVAYPELGVNTAGLADLPPEKRWRRTHGLLAPRESTVRFMQEVLTEVIEMFPGPFIHIGGDEANLRVWARDAEMQALMKRLGLEGPHELHSWFIRQMDAFLAGRGRRLVGWDEILQGGLAPGATVMSWHGFAGGVTAARAGHDVVMAPTSHTYFDYYQGPRDKEPPAIGGFLRLERVYAFDPLPPELTGAEARHILGGQGQLWGEYIATRDHRDYMAWPRGCALSETLWSPRGRRDFTEFRRRLRSHLEGLRQAGVGFRPLD
ncbi:MAG: beta-N-acetylglucosaminidase [Verrucomicrobia bacterium]|nr:MAG: beta-N-acetylglucosaminidase [Verrucomicrobiota bacterium]